MKIRDCKSDNTTFSSTYSSFCFSLQIDKTMLKKAHCEQGLEECTKVRIHITGNTSLLSAPGPPACLMKRSPYTSSTCPPPPPSELPEVTRVSMATRHKAAASPAQCAAPRPAATEGTVTASFEQEWHSLGPRPRAPLGATRFSQVRLQTLRLAGQGRRAFFLGTEYARAKAAFVCKGVCLSLMGGTQFMISLGVRENEMFMTLSFYSLCQNFCRFPPETIQVFLTHHSPPRSA